MTLLGQLMIIPFATFVYAIELMAETAREIERATTQSMEAARGSGDSAAAANRAKDTPVLLPDSGQLSRSPSEFQLNTKENTIAMSTYDNVEGHFRLSGGDTAARKDLHDTC